MNRNELKELAGNPDFISGIYNYCDRWCERCAFTSKCFLYATENADPANDDPEARDINNAKFWARLESIFKETGEMLREMAEEAGVDLDSVEAEAAAAAHQHQREQAKEHPLSSSTRNYALQVQKWFEEEFAVETSVHDDLTGQARNSADEIEVADAVDIIRWYQFFIAAKTYRAVLGLEDRLTDSEPPDIDPFADDDLSDEEIIMQADAYDSDGSAKIALIAMDRSIAAWHAMLASLPEKNDSIKPLIVKLERLRRSLEKTFPHARDFFRPGFDEAGSGLVS